MADTVPDVERPPEPAFAFSFNDHEGNHRWCQGMWLRDYIATKAMEPLLRGKTAVSLANGGDVAVAMLAYQMADAMLKVRDKNDRGG
jgi:hypothetical protein